MAKQIWRGRGRPSSRMFSYKDRTVLESLAGIAIRHKVDSNEFFDCIIEAWNHERSIRGQLTIRCRKRMRNSAIFLFTNGKKRERKVVAQFPISIAVLRGKNQLGSYADAILARERVRTSSVKNFAGITSKIGDLKVGMKKVRLKAEVLEIPKSKVVYTRYGTEACVSNTLIRDETGSMKMSLWNDQIGSIHKGDIVDVRNGRVAWFSGEKQLRLGRSGSLNVERASLMRPQ